ncbi:MULTISPECIES: hypothetical protein [Bacillus cereus group]|uniref:Uncharacterized protein n=1 Tax=Bacillus cereus (strain G9842) TaxID=405531 RepID=B7IYY0_BACC2|nr:MULTISPECIES: hypothetical protein [Bacillus cereus group]ACK98635.1 conserved hypothetical protein [Bacillus cereus G9842]MDR4137499.1 hypothetical protein [Bacillus cereus]MDR4367325.1 hypothetical protein [Bacillus cereus]PEE63378.1 hypothetical protein COM74_19925 [Bacillus thuringiensis]
MNLFDWIEKEENKNNTEEVRTTNISTTSQEEQLEDNKLELTLEDKNSSQQVNVQESNIINNEIHISQEIQEENKLESSLETKNESDKPNESSKTLELQTGEIQEESSTVVLTTIKENKESIPDKKKDVASTKKKESFVIDVKTAIRYQGQNTDLISLFTVKEITEGLTKKGSISPITEKDILKALEKEHPELDPSIAKIIYIKNKNLLIPHIPGKKNGLNEKQPSAPNESEGVFQLKILRNRLYLSNEKNQKQITIPERLICDFIKLARSFSNEFSVEVKGEIYYDLSSNSYKLFIPRQRVTHTLIEVNELTPKEALIFCEMIKVMEIHSHHIYSPIPSKIDNEHDRSRGLYYAIIGDIQNLFPSITVRILNRDSGEYDYLDPIEIISRETIATSMTPQVVVEEER